MMLLKGTAGVYNVSPTSNEVLVKRELRTKLRSVLASISPESALTMSRAAAAHLFATPEYRQTEVLMVYLSQTEEVDTTPIVLQAWKDGKTVAAPQVSWESRQMVPHEIKNLDEDIARNQFGLREPAGGLPIPIELIDLVIVPGLAFDPVGNRLGRGRGFYDRFLAKPDFKGRSCGLAFEVQIVGAIPAGEHDQKVDLLVTDKQVRRFTA